MALVQDAHVIPSILRMASNRPLEPECWGLDLDGELMLKEEVGVDWPVSKSLATTSPCFSRAPSPSWRLFRDAVVELADISKGRLLSSWQATQFTKWLFRRLRSESWMHSLPFVGLRDDGLQNSVAASSHRPPLSSAPSSWTLRPVSSSVTAL